MTKSNWFIGAVLCVWFTIEHPSWWSELWAIGEERRAIAWGYISGAWNWIADTLAWTMNGSGILIGLALFSVIYFFMVGWDQED